MITFRTNMVGKYWQGYKGGLLCLPHLPQTPFKKTCPPCFQALNCLMDHWRFGNRISHSSPHLMDTICLGNGLCLLTALKPSLLGRLLTITLVTQILLKKIIPTWAAPHPCPGWTSQWSANSFHHFSVWWVCAVWAVLQHFPCADHPQSSNARAALLKFNWQNLYRTFKYPDWRPCLSPSKSPVYLFWQHCKVLLY